MTAQQADGKSTTGITTYYNAYHSGVKPWKVRLNDNYAYGGTGLSESYSMASPAGYMQTVITIWWNMTGVCPLG